MSKQDLVRLVERFNEIHETKLNMRYLPAVDGWQILDGSGGPSPCFRQKSEAAAYVLGMLYGAATMAAKLEGIALEALKQSEEL